MKNYKKNKSHVTPHPRFGEGILRLNKNPIIILIIVAFLVSSVFAYTLFVKTRHRSHMSPSNEKTSQGSHVPQGLFLYPSHKETIPKPPQPKIFEQKTINVPQERTIAPPRQYAAAWEHYFKDVQRLQQRKAELKFQAIQADPNSNNNDEDLKNMYQTVQGDKTPSLSTIKDTDYLDSYRTGARNAYEVKEGTLLPLILISAINSDIATTVKGEIRENIYDSATGRALLIPQGSFLLGDFKKSTFSGQSRLNVTFHRLIFPDQSSIDLNQMQAVDLSGRGGMKDKVDNHWGRILGGASISTFFELLQSPTTMFNSGGATNIGNSSMIGEQIGETGQEIGQRNRQIAPTITIRPGYLFNVIVSKDMILPPYHDLWGNGLSHQIGKS